MLTENQHVADVAAANAISTAKYMPEGIALISGKQAADLFTQAAFRRSRNNGAKMAALLAEVAKLLPQHGGAFAKDPADCHPDVPGCNYFMAQWQRDFLASLQAHIALIRK